ncbi:hypothetical protein [Micromonospora mirobrigensis]|uniref:Uncharacterized protein n=1 Tax=Micromonospora mirobrigensis TaxID=262898 RepID=A0A1C5AIE2_9ACTN|nr:hypothetical protein [Micromonospora mirobrigensis]SCF44995.1 hypothetical protein GA0070564_11119 [Micromonospora mirobrigensis]
MGTLSRADALKAQQLAEQRYALAFDTKFSAAADLARLQAAEAAPDLIAAAVESLSRATALVTDARAALDQASNVHRVAWRGARP